MCDQFDSQCDVWNETARTANKRHVCDCCGSAIKPGDKYVVVSMVWEGTAASEKQCLLCARSIEKFSAEPGHMKWMPSGFVEVLEECIRESDNPAKWRPMRRAILQRQTEARS